MKICYNQHPSRSTINRIVEIFQPSGSTKILEKYKRSGYPQENIRLVDAGVVEEPKTPISLRLQ